MSIKDKQQQILEESLRGYIRELLDSKVDKKLSKLQEKRAEKQIRNFARQYIFEAKKNPVPQANTGANILEDSLRRVVPIIKDSFFTLTTDITQRRSYRAHIINGFRNALSPYRAIQGYGGVHTDPNLQGPESGITAAPDETELEFGLVGDKETVNELEVDVGNKEAKKKSSGYQIDDNDNGIPDAEEKFIEVEPEKQKEKNPDPEKEERDKFTIPGEDSTGRNVALQTFKKIEKAITDDYSLLDIRKDREIFYEYGIINLKLYFDRWEEELQSNIKEK